MIRSTYLTRLGEYSLYTQERRTNCRLVMVLRKPEYGASKLSFGVAVMNTLLGKLAEEKQRLRAELVRIQSMLRLIDDRIFEELLMEGESKDEPLVKKVDQW